MEMALSLSGGESLTLSAAQKNERNILARVKCSHATRELHRDLGRERKSIEGTKAHHPSRMDPSACVVQSMSTWIKGRFNVCILVHDHDVDGSVSKKIFRCPMAHKAGEQYSPGATDKKMRAEVAAYAWIENHCPDIPIPELHGFELSSDLQVY